MAIRPNYKAWEDPSMGLYDTMANTLGFGPAGDSADVQKMKNAGMTSEYLNDLDNRYRSRFGRGMPGHIYDRLKGDRGFADKMSQWLSMSDDELMKSDKNTAQVLGDAKIIDYNDWQAKADKRQLEADTAEFNTKLAEITGQQYTAGTFNPSGELTGKWYKTLADAEKAAEDEAIAKTNEQYNFLNQYMTGSGSQLKATNELIQNIAGDRMSRAIAGAQAEFNKQENINYADFLDTRAQKIQSLNNYGKENRGIAEYARAADAADRAREQAMQDAADIAKLYAPREQAWYEPLAAAAVGGLTSGLTSGLTGGVANLVGGKSWGYNPMQELLKRYGYGGAAATPALTAGVNGYRG